jgi:hypothetical protein
MERRDLALVSMEDLLTGSIWSTKLDTHRPIVPRHFQSDCTAISPAWLNRVRVLGVQFVPLGWPRHLEWWRSFTKSSATP